MLVADLILGRLSVGCPGFRIPSEEPHHQAVLGLRDQLPETVPSVLYLLAVLPDLDAMSKVQVLRTIDDDRLSAEMRLEFVDRVSGQGFGTEFRADHSCHV